MSTRMLKDQRARDISHFLYNSDVTDPYLVVSWEIVTVLTRVPSKESGKAWSTKFLACFSFFFFFSYVFLFFCFCFFFFVFFVTNPTFLSGEITTARCNGGCNWAKQRSKIEDLKPKPWLHSVVPVKVLSALWNALSDAEEAKKAKGLWLREKAVLTYKAKILVRMAWPFYKTNE